MKLYFIRHGEIDANIVEGGSEKLNANGKKQLRFLVKYLENLDFDLLISSDLERAKDTAKPIQKAKKIKDVKIMPELREIYRVVIGGPEKKSIDKKRIKQDKIRMEKIWEKLRNMKQKRVAIVCHAHVIRYMISKTIKINRKELWKIVIDNCSITEIEIVKGKAFLVSVNEHRHIKDNSRKGYYNLYAD